jgi:hypothetical protein
LPLLIVPVCSASGGWQVGQVLFEIRVVASLLGRHTTGRVIYQHSFKHMKTCIVKAVAEGFVEVTFPLGEG